MCYKASLREILRCEQIRSRCLYFSSTLDVEEVLFLKVAPNSASTEEKSVWDGSGKATTWKSVSIAAASGTGRSWRPSAGVAGGGRGREGISSGGRGAGPGRIQDPCCGGTQGLRGDRWTWHRLLLVTVTCTQSWIHVSFAIMRQLLQEEGSGMWTIKYYQFACLMIFSTYGMKCTIINRIDSIWCK